MYTYSFSLKNKALKMIYQIDYRSITFYQIELFYQK
jgi:hypothetical protein